MWAPEDARVYVPVYGPRGKRRGAELRKYEDGPDGTRGYNSKSPKVLAHPETAEPWTAWYRLGTGRPDGIVHPKVLVVLEDQISALKVSRHFHTAAILGTDLSEERVEEIAGIGARHTLFAMDADATGKAIDMMRDNMLLFEHTGVVLLDRDFKYVSDAEIIKRVKAAME